MLSWVRPQYFFDKKKATERGTAAREGWVIAARSRDFSARLSAAARHADATSRQRVHRLLVCVDRVARGGRRRRRRIAPAARDRTRGVDTFRFTKVLSKPPTVSRLEHVVRGRMKRARRGDGRQALVATFAAALVAISIAPLRARAAPFPADGANLKSAINNCLAADATGACDCSSSSVDCKQGNGLAIGSWDTSQVMTMQGLFN